MSDSNRGHLAHHFRHVAALRDQQARDWPADARACERSAASLRSLAAYVLALPDGDDALAVLDLINPGADFFGLINQLKSPGSGSGSFALAPAHRISRYGRSSVKIQDWEHRAFLAGLLHELAGVPAMAD